MASDGYVIENHRSYAFGIKIQKRDIQILRWLRADLDSTHPIKIIQNKYVSLRISSKTIASDLAKYNIYPRKSLTIRPPSNLPEKLKGHFWRGVIDGDGSVGRGKTGQWWLSLYGTKAMVKGFADWVEKNVGIFNHGIRPKRNIYTVSYRSIPAIYAIMHKLYDQSKRSLKRKAAYISKINSDYERQYNKPTEKQQGLIIDLYSQNHSCNNVARIVGVSKKTAYNVIKNSGAMRSKRSESAKSDPRYINNNIRKQIARDYEKNDMSPTEIAHRYQINRSTVLKIAFEFDVIRNQGAAQAERWAKKRCIN
jgi:transposase